MNADLPEPPIGPEVDLRSFTFMPLDVARLRDSDIAAVVSAEAFRAAVLLWCAAWHQLPASSLPSDDISLARLAGFGRDVTGWSAVKEEALRGFVLCRDRRLYHGVIAEKAIAAWAAKQGQKAKTEAATAARKAKYEARQRDVERDDIRDGARDVHQGRGEEKRGKDISSLRSDAASAEAAPQTGPGQAKPLKPSRRHAYPTNAFELWYGRYPHKVGRGAAEKAFQRIFKSDAVAFEALIKGRDAYIRNKPADREWCNPSTWLNQERWTDQPARPAETPSIASSGGSPRIEFGGGVVWPVTSVRDAVDRWRTDPTRWPEHVLGPPPGQPGCRVPDNLLQTAA